MKHFLLLLMKFVACIVAFSVGLDLFFNATITDILSFSLVVTVISYILGDRIILPAVGNARATLADFILTYLSVWVFGSVLLNSYLQIAWGSFISAIVVSVAEVFVHRYILNHATDSEVTHPEERQSIFNPKLAYGTEFAEEHDMHDEHEREK